MFYYITFKALKITNYFFFFLKHENPVLSSTKIFHTQSTSDDDKIILQISNQLPKHLNFCATRA